MKSMMFKTALAVAAFALLGAASAQDRQIDAGYCRDEYRLCLAAGYDPDMCFDNYWLCRYGYIPVKTGGVPAAIDRRR